MPTQAPLHPFFLGRRGWSVFTFKALVFAERTQLVQSAGSATIYWIETSSVKFYATNNGFFSFQCATESAPTWPPKNLSRDCLTAGTKVNRVVNPQSTPQLLAREQDRRKSRVCVICLEGGSISTAGPASQLGEVPQTSRSQIGSDRRHGNLQVPPVHAQIGMEEIKALRRGDHRQNVQGFEQSEGHQPTASA